MKPRRVVITGIGVIAPNGIGKEAFWEGLSSGRSGISKITSFDVSELPTQIAGQVKEFDPSDYIPQKKWTIIGRQTQMGLAAAILAVQDAALSDHRGPFADGLVVVGTCNPAYDLVEPEILRIHQMGLSGVTPGVFMASDPCNTSTVIARWFGLTEGSRTIITSCTSGLTAIGHGFREIQMGRARFCLAGGADAPITPACLASFCAAGILSKRNEDPTKASRPFDRTRDGGVLSEGAGVLVLEEMHSAVQRGATIYAEIMGYGESSMSARNSLIEDGFIAAMTKAFHTAKLFPEQIDYISAHGPSDPHVDRIETQAIKSVFGEKAYYVPVSSIKSMIGNPLSGAGPIQAISCLLSISRGILPPTINYQFPDADCDLDYVPNEARKARVERALALGHGVSGTESCLILGSFVH